MFEEITQGFGLCVSAAMEYSDARDFCVEDRQIFHYVSVEGPSFPFSENGQSVSSEAVIVRQQISTPIRFGISSSKLPPPHGSSLIVAHLSAVAGAVCFASHWARS
jgi:hypothetical protein